MNRFIFCRVCRAIPYSVVLMIFFAGIVAAKVQAQTVPESLSPDRTVDPTVDRTVDPTVDRTVDPTVDRTVDPTVDPTVNRTVTPPSSLRRLPNALLRPAERSPYILGTGDQMEVTVLGYEEYTGIQTVLPDGSITMPLAGTIPAAGKTADQLAQAIAVRLNEYIVDPVVTVSLQVLRPVVITVSGEVSRPGPLQLRSLSETELSSGERSGIPTTPTLSTALIQAGGITSHADLRRVQLRRQQPDGSVIEQRINLWNAIATDNASPDIILQDGDAIYIPRLQTDNTVDRRLLTRSSFAPAGVRVRVVGEVKAPGEVQVPPNSSLSSAVAIAGGPTEDARLSRVALVRLNQAGEIERETIDLRNLTDNYQIQEGDVIFVPKRSSSSVVDFAGRLFSPLGVILNLFN